MLEDFHLGASLQWYTSVLRRWSWLVVLVAILASLAAYVTSRFQIPTYQASTRLLINQGSVAGDADYNAILTSERLAGTYSELLATRPLLTQVIEQLALPFSVGDLASKVDVQPVPNRQLISVSVEDESAERSALIANTVVDVFITQTRQLESARYADAKQELSAQLDVLETNRQQAEADVAALETTPENATQRERLQASLEQYQQSTRTLRQSYDQILLAEAQSSSNVVQVEPAEVPIRPISPNIPLNTALAGVIGLVLALVGVYLREALDDTVKDPTALGKAVNLPVLGMIAELPLRTSLIVADQPRSPIAEAFRSLRTNIQFASVDRPIKTLLVVSASPGEGKTTVASNLGVVLAQNDQQVILVDADLRRPAVHKRFNLSNRRGLSNLFVEDNTPLASVSRASVVQGLDVVTSGGTPPNPAELLGSGKMSDILRQMQEHAKIVIVDTSPILPVTDAVVLAQHVDGVLFVVRAGATKVGACRQAVNQLRHVGANLIGVVINDIDVRRIGYGYYTYYDSYASSDDSNDNAGPKAKAGRFPDLFHRRKRKIPANSPR